MRYTGLLTVFLLGVVVLIGGCKCDEAPCGYDVPATYSFANVNYQGQTNRLDMVEEMTTLMKTGNTSGTLVSSATLKDMYANRNAAFSDANLNASSKDLQSKTFALDTAQILGWMDALETASQSTVAGSDGVAGVVTSGTSAYLLDENGVEYTQWIEKGLMGSLMYYQIAAVYLSDDKVGPSVDNTNVTPGEGTAMEHHWDEAFGYFGVEPDFPTNTGGIRFIGKYCDARDALLGSNATLMDSYKAGRAAISNGDMDFKDEMRAIISMALEEVFAGTALHYLNEAKSNFADDAIRCHVLSEATAFIRGLKYNPNATVNTTQIDAILASIGTNYYQVTQTGIDDARNQLSTLFGWDEIKNQF